MIQKIIRNISTYQKQQKYQYIYGINPVELALHSKRRTIQSLFVSNSVKVQQNFRVTKLIRYAEQMGISIMYISKQKITKLVSSQPHQNIVLKASVIPFFEWQVNQKFSNGIYIFTDKITDPQNYGSILRSSLYFGVKRIFSGLQNHCPLNPTVNKVSSGALELIDVMGIVNVQLFMSQWKKNGGYVMVADIHPNSIPVDMLSQICFRQNLTKIIVIIGSQGNGISPHLHKYADYNIELKRRGNLQYPYTLIDSLNVSCALSAILFELTKSKQ